MFHYAFLAVLVSTVKSAQFFDKWVEAFVNARYYIEVSYHILVRRAMTIAKSILFAYFGAKNYRSGRSRLYGLKMSCMSSLLISEFELSVFNARQGTRISSYLNMLNGDPCNFNLSCTIISHRLLFFQLLDTVLLVWLELRKIWHSTFSDIWKLCCCLSCFNAHYVLF